jgi:hypothetical protein
MAELTLDQARTLADAYLAAAEDVSDFRFRERARLTDADVVALKSVEHKLSDLSDNFTAIAIQLALDNLQQVLDRIVQATADVRAAIAKLKEVAKVLEVAANLIALGEAVSAGNAEGVIGALKSTRTAIAG